MTPPSPHVHALWRYPLKSARGEPLDRARLDPLGVLGDRRYALVAPDGRALTQRQLPQMARIEARWADGDRLTLSAPGAPSLALAPPPATAEVLEIRMWGERFPARAVGEQADAWCSRALGRPARLAYLPPTAARPVDPRYGRPGDRVALADGYPLLVTNQASLEALRRRGGPGGPPLSMERFRPNLVVAGAPPFAEDSWAALRVGGLTLELVKPCSRCVMVNVDPATGVKDARVLRHLAGARRRGRRILFGVNAVARPDRGPAEVRVGDPVEVVGLRPTAPLPDGAGLPRSGR